MLTMNVPGRRHRLTAYGLAAALVLSGSNLANAQIIIVDPNRLPDLAVSVAAPVSTVGGPSSVEALTIRVTNHGPLGTWGRSGNDIKVNVDLTGYRAYWVESNNNLNCSFGPAHGLLSPDVFSIVRCTGSLAWGSTATIVVYAYATAYCVQPAYTDASVTTSATERSTANNRAIARTDSLYCGGY